MFHIFHHTFHHHKAFWNRERLLSLLWAFIFFWVALTFQKYSDNYVIERGGTIVWDLILDNIPTLDIDGIIMISTLFFTLVVIILGVLRPQYVIFGMKSLALFVSIRAFFITLTHLGVQPNQLVFSNHAVGYYLYDLLYNTKNDFFFSGHTGVPFLVSLIFYREKFWHRIFLGTSLLFGTFVLIGHMHYSIDVFAAPFMTYTIFCIARSIFPKDYEVTQTDTYTR